MKRPVATSARRMDVNNLARYQEKMARNPKGKPAWNQPPRRIQVERIRIKPDMEERFQRIIGRIKAALRP